MSKVIGLNPAIYRFSDFEVDLHRQEIRHQGTEIPTQRRTFDLLVYLLENPNRTIDQQELQQAVWIGTKVSNAVVKVCVGKVRRLLGDDPKRQAIIKTINGFGYRFVAPVEVERTATASFLAEGYQAAMKENNKLSIAVLPFRDFGENSEHEYFSEGITEDIITELSRFHSLFVTSPQTTRSFNDSPDDARIFSGRLGVTYTVQGSIRRSKSRIRVTVHLIEARSDRRIWSESYDRELEDIPMIHEDVSRTIAATIGGRVEAHRKRRPFDSAGVKVYDAFLRAKSLHYKDSKPENAEAQALLEEVIAIAPCNALAYSWLAMTHAYDAWYRWSADPDHSMRMAVEFGRKALSIDDSEYVIHSNYGEIMDYLDDLELAEAHFRRALELNPNDVTSRSFYAIHLARCGHREEAVQHMAVANRLDPFGQTWTPWANGVLMYAVGRYSEAIEWFGRLTNADNLARPLLAAALSKEGDLDRARIVLEKFLQTAQKDMVRLPGNHEEDWIEYLRVYITFDSERDFDDSYDALLKAGWRELLGALPDFPEAACAS